MLRQDQRKMNPAPSAPLALHFDQSNGAVDDAIAAVMELAGGIGHREIVREMILAALKAGQESQERADLKLMNVTLKEMRFTAKVFGPYRQRRKVSVFGSARLAQNTPLYIMAQDLGRELVRRGFMVITGGGPGVMQAVNEGAGPRDSFGVNIRLPFEQRANPVVEGNPRHIRYKYFFTRKVAFLKEADAVVLFPGGFGTMDEAMESVTLLQSGKRAPLPLVLVDTPGSSYWSRWLDFIGDELVARGFVAEDDLALISRAETVAAAAGIIEAFYRRFHSIRYVNGQLLLRLLRPLPPAVLQQLRETFADILVPGGELKASAALPEERDEPALHHLPRLLVDFDRRHFGRLHRLISAINAVD